MIPEFILTFSARKMIHPEQGEAYLFRSFDHDSGYVLWYPESNETFHTYKHPDSWGWEFADD